VLFLSDYGHYIGDHGRVGKSGQGPDGPWPLYEEVAHINLMGRVPAGLQGTRLDFLAQPVDTMPTILDLAGLPIPDSVHGQSLKPLFFGESLPQRPITVTSLGLSSDASSSVCSSITDGAWTLHYRGPNHPAELYDLEEDEAQEHNLYSERIEEAERLHTAHLELLERVGADSRKVFLRRDLPA
jgi:arylsulfatase A-like enzyme